MNAPRDIVVIGVGNRFRGDDGVGPAVVDRLRADPPPGALIRESSGDAAALIDLWQDAELVLVVDAVLSGALPGTVHYVEASGEPLPPEVFQTSTHSFGLGQAVELARTLGRLPTRLIIYGVEGVAFEHGQILSQPAGKAVDKVAMRIRECIQHRGSQTCDSIREDS